MIKCNSCDQLVFEGRSCGCSPQSSEGYPRIDSDGFIIPKHALVSLDADHDPATWGGLIAQAWNDVLVGHNRWIHLGWGNYIKSMIPGSQLKWRTSTDVHMYSDRRDLSTRERYARFGFWGLPNSNGFSPTRGMIGIYSSDKDSCKLIGVTCSG